MGAERRSSWRYCLLFFHPHEIMTTGDGMITQGKCGRWIRRADCCTSTGECTRHSAARLNEACPQQNRIKLSPSERGILVRVFLFPRAGAWPNVGCKS